MEIRRSCGLCHPRCGMLLRGKRQSRQNHRRPGPPRSRGVLCERGRLMLDHIYHPGRLNRVETGRQEGGEVAADHLGSGSRRSCRKARRTEDEYGAETLAFTHGTKRTYHWDCRRFFNCSVPQHLRREHHLHVPQLCHGVCYVRRHGHG